MNPQPSHPDTPARAASRTATDPGIRVDRIACTGHGICASILPRTVHLDEWGYPVVGAAGPGDGPEARAAAVRLCPAMALSLSSAG
jgi:ferredoxin